MIKDECTHGKMIGKAGITVSGRLPYAGLFCPDEVCEPIWFLTKFIEEGESDE